MMIYDFCLAWNWQYDQDFVQYLSEVCNYKGVSLLQVTPDNLEQVLRALDRDEISFRVFFDRASDSEEGFIPIVQWARLRPVLRINPFDLTRQAWDKASCHHLFAKAGLPTPRTFILPPYEDQPYLSPLDLGFLGSNFSIKPAHGGGGNGVVTEATSWSQVMHFRKEYPQDEYLLQSYIIPAYLDNRQAWFRNIYCCGKVYPCWWDTHTHIYTPISPGEEEYYHLQPLREMMESIHEMVGLDLFSTEIARTPEGQFIVIDYVNDPIDLRLQSKAGEGVPDAIVADVADQLICTVKESIQYTVDSIQYTDS